MPRDTGSNNFRRRRKAKLFGLLALPFAIMTALLLPRSGYEDDILGMRREIEDIRGILEDIKDNKN